MPAEANGGRRRRVVVVGGGFGGLTVARELRRADADVTLVDRTNHHLFQPLLYQVAAGGLSEGDCASAIRGHLRKHPNASVLMAEVTDLDVERRRVILDRGRAARLRQPGASPAARRPPTSAMTSGRRPRSG